MLTSFAFLDIGFPELLMIAIFVAVLVFEVAMFVHAFRNHSISSNTRILWLVGMAFIHPFVAIAYYFTDHNKA